MGLEAALIPEQLKGNGHTDIAVTGTAIVLRAPTHCRQVMIKADPDNVGTVYIGVSTVTNSQSALTGGMQMAPGDANTFPVTSLSLVYINGAAGDGVSYLWWDG